MMMETQFNKHTLEKEAQPNLHSFPVDELKETGIKVENSSHNNDGPLTHMVKSEFLEFHNIENSDDLNQSDIQAVTLEKIPKTEAKILGDEPPSSSDEEDSHNQNDTQSTSDSDSDPERDPFADIDCDPSFSQKQMAHTHSLNSPATQDEVTNRTDGSHSSSKILPTTIVQLTFELQCQLCRQIQSSEEQLKIHINSCPVPHTDEKGRRRFCIQCNKLYAHVTDYRKHALKMHGIQELHSKPFKCDVCGRNFVHQLSLNAHLALHQQEGNVASAAKEDGIKVKPFKCSECPSGFAYIGGLILHSKSHKIERPFKCPMPNCGSAFLANRTLNGHLRSVHFDENPFKCKELICGKTFKTSRELQVHTAVHVNSGVRKFKCPRSDCDRMFKSESCIRSHLRIHTGAARIASITAARPFECVECSRAFRFKCKLLKHLDTHKKDEKDFLKCPESNCSVKFKCKESIKMHVETVHRNKDTAATFECPEPSCDKKFKTEKYMKDHFRSSHTRPFKCRESGCSAAFPRPHLLKSHVQLKHS